MPQDVLGDALLLADHPRPLRTDRQAQRPVEGFHRERDQLGIGSGEKLGPVDAAHHRPHEDPSLGGALGKEIRLEDRAKDLEILSWRDQKPVAVRFRAERLGQEGERDHRHARRLDRRKAARDLGLELPEERGRRLGRSGDDHRVGLGPLPAREADAPSRGLPFACPLAIPCALALVRPLDREDRRVQAEPRFSGIRECPDKTPHSGPKAPEPPPAQLLLRVRHCEEKGAVLPFHLSHERECRVERELGRVSREDSAHRRAGQRARGLLPDVAGSEFQHGFLPRDAARHDRLGENAEPRAGRDGPEREERGRGRRKKMEGAPAR